MAPQRHIIATSNQKVTFKIFPQNPFAGRIRRDIQPGTLLTQIEVTPRGTLWSGCAPDDPKARGLGDDQIYVANYRQKTAYESSAPAPHIDTAKRPPSAFAMGLRPESVGTSFTHLDPGGWDRLSSRVVDNAISASTFAVAMVYALARETIDLWESYIGKRLVWYCAQDGRRERRGRLEIVPLVATCGFTMHKNAVSSYGYIELGVADPRDGDLELIRQPGRKRPDAPPPPRTVPFWLNADTLAHEIGHQILYATLGFGANPPGDGTWLDVGGRESGQRFRAFHESFGDVVAIMAALRSDLVLDHVLEQTQGFLYQDTALTNIGEVTATRTIRDVHIDDDNAPGGTRDPGLSPEEKLVRQYYAMSKPLTGAFFDILASLSVRFLVQQGQVDKALVEGFEENVFGRMRPMSDTEPDPLETALHKLFAELGSGPFKEAIRRAGHVLGKIFGAFLANPGPFEPAAFNFDALMKLLLKAGENIAGDGTDVVIGGKSLDRTIRRSFARRFSPIP